MSWGYFPGRLVGPTNYARGSRWKRTSSRKNRLEVGGGDTPTLNTGTVADFLHRAMGLLLDTFRECVNFYVTILGEHGVTVSDKGVTLRLR